VTVVPAHAVAVDSASNDMAARTKRSITPIGAMRELAMATNHPDHWALYESAVRKALAEARGNVTRAAELLGVSLRTMQRIVKDERFADIERAGPGRPAEEGDDDGD